MAEYKDLAAIMHESTLRNKIAVACGVAAEAIQSEDAQIENHANRLIWAKRAYEQPHDIAQKMQWAVIVANKGLSIAQILAASDSAIQTNVDAMVDAFADGS